MEYFELRKFCKKTSVYLCGMSLFLSVSVYADEMTINTTDVQWDLSSEILFGQANDSSRILTLTNKDGKKVLHLEDDEWSQITDVELKAFIDDGSGYIDLGEDNIVSYTEDQDQDLINYWDGTWLTLNGQVVSVYSFSDLDEDGDGLYITRKSIPVLFNGTNANLIIEFNEEDDTNSVIGVLNSSLENDNDYMTVSIGDEIQPICNYYEYDETVHTYTLGDAIVVSEEGLSISNKKLETDASALYTIFITGLNNEYYWTPLTKRWLGRS